MAVWTIVGASRGIGHEFVRQLLVSGEQVIATVRDSSRQTWASDEARPLLFECNMLSSTSIERFAEDVKSSGLSSIDYLVLNAGILHYPNRATELTYDDFLLHLQTNTVGPILTAQKLLQTGIDIGLIVFMSSDSGSASKFNAFEDGFAAYAASKAALNQALRHMAAELKRKGSATSVIALHPGEVKTDMASIEVDWEVHGQMSVSESVQQCIDTIKRKSSHDNGTFWTWQNEQYPW